MQPTRRYTKQVHAQMGHEIYLQRVEPQLSAELRGKIVAVDIETGEFEVGDKVLETTDKLRARFPDAQIWCERVGFPAVYSFGTSLRAEDA